MIEAIKSDEIIRKVGGRFKLTALIQRRWQELLEGARPLIEREGRNDLELAIAEILAEKITIDYTASDVTDPGTALK
ncbi:MAG: DNA-directed RNA polymerase subunit omega [Planctomycetes bacterium]|nr:DNA-directed RNA polymerase subunit omega [Planctomycetota bacterium]